MLANADGSGDLGQGIQQHRGGDQTDPPPLIIGDGGGDHEDRRPGGAGDHRFADDLVLAVYHDRLEVAAVGDLTGRADGADILALGIGEEDHLVIGIDAEHPMGQFALNGRHVPAAKHGIAGQDAHVVQIAPEEIAQTRRAGAQDLLAEFLGQGDDRALDLGVQKVTEQAEDGGEHQAETQQHFGADGLQHGDISLGNRLDAGLLCPR